MKKTVLAALAATTLALTFGVGQAQAAPTTYLTDWAPEDMKSILAEVDAKVIDEGKTAKGAPYINAETKEGLKFVVFGTACDVGPTKRCRGAEFSSDFTLDSDEAVAAKVKSLDYVAVTIMDDGDKTLNVHRYVIFDYGIARENLKLNLTVFLDIADTIWNDL